MGTKLGSVYFDVKGNKGDLPETGGRTYDLFVKVSFRVDLKSLPDIIA
jgi:hypothetical protein